MSFEDLKRMVEGQRGDPAPREFATPHEVLSKQGRGILAIVAQREIEDAFFDAEQEGFFVGGDIRRDQFVADPADIGDHSLGKEPPSAATEVLRGQRARERQVVRQFPSGPGAKETLRNVGFALDYGDRLLRSALAITGLSAMTDRFGDVRRSQGFWIAVLDAANYTSNLTNIPDSLFKRKQEQVDRIIPMLTDPSIPSSTLPGVGNLPVEILNAPEDLEWIYDLVGSLSIENAALKGGKKVIQRGVSKLTRTVYEGGEDIVKKGGIRRILGELADEDIVAIEEASRIRKFGKLGTKPPQKDIDNSVTRTFEYIQDTKDARVAKGDFITSQRRQAAAKMGVIQRNAQQTGEYGPGFAKRLRAASRMETAEKAFKPLLEASPRAGDDLSILNRTISNFDFGVSKEFTTTNAHEALAKLYEYGELLTQGEVEILRDVFGSDFANALGKFTKKATGVVGKTAEAASSFVLGAANLSRTLQTTGELSFLLRQGNFRAWSRPQEAMRSFMWAGRALVSPEYATRLDDAMRFSASGKRALANDLFLGKFGDNVFRLNEAEEVFMAQWLKGVPGIGAVVKPFERGYTVGLNRLRLDWFDEGMELLEQAGKAGDEKLVGQWATYVNNMTGRADIDDIASANKAMRAMAKTAKATLFAPRFAASRWNRHRAAAQLVFGADTPAAMRGMLVSDTVLRWRRYERLAHFAEQSGMEVETNPQSSDFMKIKSGASRFDILGGDVQIQVLMARIATGQTKDVDTKLIKDAAALDLAQRYLTNKLNPLWSLAFDKIVGQTAEGLDIDDPKVLAKEIRDKFIPLYIQDLKDKIFHAYEEEGKTVAESIESSNSMAIMGFLGAGLQTFEPSARKEYELLVNDTAQKMHGQDFADLTPQKKRDVIWLAEADNFDRIELLKEEMGMFQPTRLTASRRQKTLNKSGRIIREGLGGDFRLFEESNVDTGEFSLNLGDVRLNTEQHEVLHEKYIKFIKAELNRFPGILEKPPSDLTRRLFLQDVVTIAREDAIFEMFAPDFQLEN